MKVNDLIVIRYRGTYTARNIDGTYCEVESEEVKYRQGIISDILESAREGKFLHIGDDKINVDNIIDYKIILGDKK